MDKPAEINELVKRYGMTIPEECVGQAEPISDLAQELYAIAVLYGELEPEEKPEDEAKIRTYINAVKNQVSRRFAPEDTARKIPFEYGLAVVDKAEKHIDKGQWDEAFDALVEGAVWLGRLHMLAAAECICGKQMPKT